MASSETETSTMELSLRVDMFRVAFLLRGTAGMFAAPRLATT
jgi:hypothetical protein